MNRQKRIVPHYLAVIVTAHVLLALTLTPGCGERTQSPTSPNSTGSSRSTGSTNTQASSDADPTAPPKGASPKNSQAAGSPTQNSKPNLSSPAISRAKALFNEGDVSGARSVLRSQLIADPSNAAVMVLLAQADAMEQKWQSAFDTALPLIKNPATSADALQVIAKAVNASGGHDAYGNPNVAWLAMEKAIAKSPGDTTLRHSIVRLLNHMGDRHRACLHVDQLCRSGHATVSELQSIVNRRNAFEFEDEPSTPAFEWPLGEARLMFTRHQYHEAATLLESQNAQSRLSGAGFALWGISLVRSQDLEAIPHWLLQCPDKATQYA
ncbi:hypothetical protein N9N28_06990, partial [Rubripirellula amarantea]|nr:hypothetical protein [Rubripirellula amarantea]